MDKIIEIQLNRITRVKYIQNNEGNIKRHVNGYEFGWTTPLEHSFVEHIIGLNSRIEEEKRLRQKFQQHDADIVNNNFALQIQLRKARQIILLAESLFHALAVADSPTKEVETALGDYEIMRHEYFTVEESDALLELEKELNDAREV